MDIQRNPNPEQQEEFQRFGWQFRIQHIVLFSSVIMLVVTGVPMWLALGEPGHIKADTATMSAFGDLQVYRDLHKFSGVVLTVVAIYHLLYLAFSREGRREFMALMPMVKDITDVIQNIMFFAFMTNKRPKFGRFTYYEKFDYWAVYWGCVIMIGTGLILWFPAFFGQFMPQWLGYEMSLAVHADEAILAFLALFVWHFYNVHYKPSKFPGSRTWINGKITREEMLEEHPLEYEQMLKQKQEKS